MNTFQIEIRGLRAALSLTQHEVAAILDVRSQSVCNWEAGRSSPWPKNQQNILRQLRARVPEGTRLQERNGNPSRLESSKGERTRRRRVGDSI